MITVEIILNRLYIYYLVNVLIFYNNFEELLNQRLAVLYDKGNIIKYYGSSSVHFINKIIIRQSDRSGSLRCGVARFEEYCEMVKVS